jgi:hypothetical protein
MSNPWTVSAHGTRISYPTHDWEKQGGNTEEGPYVLQRNGKTFLTFSASSCNTPDYKIGMLSLTPVNGGYLIANRGNGLILDVTNCGTADGVAVRQWASLGNTCQQWKLTV